MSQLFTAQYQVVWSDIDMNGHMANSRYLDYATQTRFQAINSAGFTPSDFQRHKVGPIIFEDRLRYLNELHFLERFTVDFQLEPTDESGRKFRCVNRFERDGEAVAEVVALGAWMDLAARKITPPPDALAIALKSHLPRPDHD